MKKKLFLSLYIVLNTLYFQSSAQKENNIWYFGKNAGLDFNSGAPVPLTNGALNTWEGCASVADGATGSLLFYTDGENVWNRNHVTMPNGTGLWGQYSSTQSALIVPIPGSATLYYLFTTDAGTGGNVYGGVMAYSVIDMSLAGGLGDVTTKNTALFDTTSEQQTATLHADGCRIWVVAHKWNSNAFYSYLVSDVGISAPVISNAGSIHNCAYFGQLKISSDGRKLAQPLPCDAAGNSFVELFDFDNATGIVSNSVQLPQEHLVYGLEFSPNSKFLYTADHNNSSAIIYKQVSQFDVTLGSAAAINASRVIVGIVWNATTFFGGSAQLAPDGKIYVVPTDGDSMCVVNYPDSAGLACNFVVPGLYLGGQRNDHGLPNIVVKAIYPCAAPVSFFSAPDTLLCANECISFTNLSVNATTYQWNFFGGAPSSSTDSTPQNICYNNAGTFDVTLISGNGSYYDTLTLTNYIIVNPLPPAPSITQVSDTLFSPQGYTTYQWYFGSDTLAGATDYYYVATQSGNYNLAVTNEFGCSVGAGVVNVIAGIAPSASEEGWGEVFPNPAKDNITVTMVNRQSSVVNLEIYNSLGEKVYAVILSGVEGKVEARHATTINTSYLNNGIYLVKMSTGENNITKQFVVKK